MLTELSVLLCYDTAAWAAWYFMDHPAFRSCLDLLRDWTRNAKEKGILGDFMVAEVER